MGIKHITPWEQIICPSYTPSTSQKVIFSEEGHVAYQITKKKCRTCKSNVKRSDIDCADKNILIEFSDLIGVGYDLSDTQDGLRCWRNDFYILW